MRINYLKTTYVLNQSINQSMVFDLKPIQFVAQGCLIKKGEGGNLFYPFLYFTPKKNFPFLLKIIPNFWEKKKFSTGGRGDTQNNIFMKICTSVVALYTV